MRNLFSTSVLFSFLLSLNAQVASEWQFVFGGSDFDRAKEVLELPDGYLIAGVSYSEDFDMTDLDRGVFVIKVSFDGNIIWKKTYDGTGDTFFLTDMIQTSDGGVVLLATIFTDSYKGWVCKINSDSGAIIWEDLLGGSDNENLNDVLETTDGNLLLTGRARSTDGDVTSNFPNSSNAWLVMLSADGNKLWDRIYFEDTSNRFETAVETDNGTFLLLDYAFEDYQVLHINATGDVLWKKSFGGTDHEYGYNILKDEDGNFVIGGYTRSDDGDIPGSTEFYDFWFLKIDIDGEVIDSRTYGTERADLLFAMNPTADGGYIAGGYSGDFVSATISPFDPDALMYFIKLDKDLNEMWTLSLGGSDYDVLHDIEETSDGGFLLGGRTTSSDGDLPETFPSVIPGVIQDAWIVKLGIDEDGDGVTVATDCNDADANSFPGNIEICDGIDNNCDTQIDEGLELVVYYADLDMDGFGDDDSAFEDCMESSGFITMGGDCDDNNPNIYPGADEIPNNDIDEDCDGEDAISTSTSELNSDISIYPNPVRDILYIDLSSEPIKIEIYNSQSHLLYEGLTSDRTIDVTTFGSGVYLIKLMKANGENVGFKKFLKF